MIPDPSLSNCSVLIPPSTRWSRAPFSGYRDIRGGDAKEIDQIIFPASLSGRPSSIEHMAPTTGRTDSREGNDCCCGSLSELLEQGVKQGTQFTLDAAYERIASVNTRIHKGARNSSPLVRYLCIRTPSGEEIVATRCAKG